MIRKVLKRAGFFLSAGTLSVLGICGMFFPEVYQDLIPYRVHYVLTDSMEPTIGTNSLVLVKQYTPDMELKEDDIITFLANRFGEELVIMHRFSHTEVNDQGELVYKTHPEGSRVPDMYDTKREDILGVYQFHIPYAGKFLLFLRSAFGFLWICQTVVILLIHEVVRSHWDRAAEPSREDRPPKQRSLAPLS